MSDIEFQKHVRKKLRKYIKGALKGQYEIENLSPAVFLNDFEYYKDDDEQIEIMVSVFKDFENDVYEIGKLFKRSYNFLEEKRKIKVGCFSYLCKGCGDPINSDSSRGERVKLFYLKQGKVVQEMEGEYDSYGTVFDKTLKDSVAWKGTESDINEVWNKMIEEHYNEDPRDGFAAIHSTCFKGVPVTISKDDENQGWGPLNPNHMPESEYMIWLTTFTECDDDEEEP